MKRNGLFDVNRRQSNSTGELSANTEQGKSFSLSKVLTFVGNCTCVWSGCDAESDMSIHNLSQDVAYLFGCDYSHARTMLCFRDDTGYDYGSDWDLFNQSICDQVPFLSEEIMTQIKIIIRLNDKTAKIQQIQELHSQLSQSYGNEFILFPKNTANHSSVEASR